MKPFTFWAGLAAATFILALMQITSFICLRKEPNSPSWSVFHHRVRDWWSVLGAIAFCYALGPGALIFAFFLSSFMALREVLSVTPVKPSDAHPLFVAFFIAVPGQYLLLAFRAYGLFSIYIPVYIFFALTALAVFAKDKTDFLARNARIQWALMVTVYGVSFAPALLTLAPEGQSPDGMMLFFYLFVSQLSESLQFLGSKIFGRAPLTERLPNVTAEGVVIAAALSFGLGASMCAVTPFSWWQAGLAGSVISMTGMCGVLAMASAKESLGIKRWRPASEAQGGMTERIDALCFSAPIFFHIAKMFFPG